MKNLASLKTAHLGCHARRYEANGMDPNAVPGPGDPKPPEPNRAALDEVTSFLTAALATTSPCWRLFCVCHSVCPFTCCTLSPHSYQHLLLFAVAIAARARRLNLVLLPALSQARMEVQAERIAEAKRRARDVSRHNLLAAANADALDELERDPGGPGRAPPPQAAMIWVCPNPSCGATFPTEEHFLKHGRPPALGGDKDDGGKKKKGKKGKKDKKKKEKALEPCAGCPDELRDIV